MKDLIFQEIKRIHDSCPNGPDYSRCTINKLSNWFIENDIDPIHAVVNIKELIVEGKVQSNIDDLSLESYPFDSYLIPILKMKKRNSEKEKQKESKAVHCFNLKMQIPKNRFSKNYVLNNMKHQEIYKKLTEEENIEYMDLVFGIKK